MVASGLDFLTGITAAGEELLLGVALGLDFVAAGEEDLLGEAVVSGFGDGEAVFSVVTDTVGSEGVVSGSGVGLSSWANARGAAARRAVRQRTVIFIGFSWLIWRPEGRLPRVIEGRILGSGTMLRQGPIRSQNPLAVIVLSGLDGQCSIVPQSRKMRLPTIRSIFGSLGLAALIVYTMRLPDHPTKAVAATTAPAPVPVPALSTPQPTLVVARPIDVDFQMPVRPLTRNNRIDHCFTAEPAFATPVIWRENAVIVAALKQDWETVRKLIDAGAPVESTNQTGLTALMVAAQAGNLETLRALIDRQARIEFMDFEGRTAIDYALAAGQRDAVEILFSMTKNFDPSSAGAHRLLSAAMATGDTRIFQTILERFPPTLAWTAETRRALESAMKAGLNDQVRLLLSKHSAPPTRADGVVPLIAYAIAAEDVIAFQMLLGAGADPNTVIPKTAEKEFTDLLKSKYLRLYIQADGGVNILMLAAGLGRTDFVRALLDAGANRNQMTTREKMLPLYFAAWTENWQCVQMLLGGGPQPEQLRVEISLVKQHMAVIKDGATVFETKVSTGRDGFKTKPGYYVITDKDRDHRSTIYKCPMPYFMRLSCRDFGMHEGVVQPYPASHGCIRLPGDAAKKLFGDLPIGTVVSIN